MTNMYMRPPLYGIHETNFVGIYSLQSLPVEEFYRRQGKLLEFDLPGGIPESWPKLLQVLRLDDHHEDKQLAAA